MATYLADRVIVYEGKPSIDCIANSPQSLLTGMNLFLSVSVIICQWFHYFFLPFRFKVPYMLKFTNYVVICAGTCMIYLMWSLLQHLDITFRRDPNNFRPRINKLDSTKDREQKHAGSYYYLDDWAYTYGQVGPFAFAIPFRTLLSFHSNWKLTLVFYCCSLLFRQLNSASVWAFHGISALISLVDALTYKIVLFPLEGVLLNG